MLTLEAIGMTQEELQERVVEAAVHQILHTTYTDEEGDPYPRQSEFRHKIERQIEQRINETVAAIGDKHVLPKITEMVENLCLQRTTEWGEKRGKPMSFIEYLTQRADEYLREEVNYEGKSRHEVGSSYSFSRNGTRVTYLIDKHLQTSIATAMQNALKEANASLVGGLEAAVKQKLSEISQAIKVGVQVGR